MRNLKFKSPNKMSTEGVGSEAIVWEQFPIGVKSSTLAKGSVIEFPPAIKATNPKISELKINVVF